MQNEQILATVAIIAVLALLARIIINQQQKGRVNWPKLGAILLLAATFVSVMLTFDAYRAETLLLGKTSPADISTPNAHIIGRQPSPQTPHINTLNNTLTPPYFTLNIDTLTPTGYYKRKTSDNPQPLREQLVSQSDTSRVAIKRTTSSFNITRHPDHPSDYLPLYHITTTSGEHLLALLTTYDAHPGTTPIGAAIPLDGKLSQIAAADTTLNQNIYLTFFDTPHYTHARTTLLAISAIAALLATAIIALLARITYTLITKHNPKCDH